MSATVIAEASLGNAEMARRRLASIDGITSLAVKSEAARLAADLVRNGGLPARAGVDAPHIAVAATGGMEYLLTWNGKHIADAQARRAVDRVCLSAGLEAPVIRAPEELLGEGA